MQGTFLGTADLSSMCHLILVVNCVLWACLLNSGCIFYYCSLTNNKDISEGQWRAPWNVKCVHKFLNVFVLKKKKKKRWDNLVGYSRLFTLPVRISPLNYKELSAHSNSANTKSRNPTGGSVPAFSQWCKLLCQYQPGCTG